MNGADVLRWLQLAMLALGLAFGVVAERTAFCFRSGILELIDAAAARRRGEPPAPLEKASAWIVALGTAALATQIAIVAGVLDVSGTPYLQAAPPLLSIAFGGLLFGVGMVWCGGCISRLMVLGAGGNLRSVVSLLVLAVVAYASIRGLLAPARSWLEGVGRLDLAPLGGPTWQAMIARLTGANDALVGVTLGALLFVLAFVWIARSVDAPRRQAVVGAGLAVGALGALGWVATAAIGAAAFDPPPPQSLRFTETLADSLLYALLSTGVELKPGVLLVVGVLVGAHLSARLGGRLALQGFDGARATARYMAGGALMGVGGVLALGCTVGQGLTGMSTLAVGSLLALAAMAAGAWVGRRTLAHWQAG